MRKFEFTSCLALTFVAASIIPALAHVVLEVREAVVGRPYKAVFRVTHGCEGSPTVKVTVNVPEGIIAVKPMPKAGWTIELVKGDYAKSYAFFHGKKLDSGVKRVVWTGGSLPDEYYDEFVMNTFVAGELSPGVDVPFIVTQECEKGEMTWREIASGDHAHHLKWPAPLLKLLPKKDAAHQH